MTARGVAWLIGIAVIVWVAGVRADGDVVALLPLQAERSLEIYGQPVASEIARGLGAAGVQVVVVGRKAAVPERARLVIDGTIAHGKAPAVVISLRIRRHGETGGGVIDTVSATAPGLARLDVAAGELSARVLPIVKASLAAPSPVEPAAPPAAVPEVVLPIALVSVHDASRTTDGAALAAVLDDAATAWLRRQRREPRLLDAAKLAPKLAPAAVRDAGAELAVGFWVLGYQPQIGRLPMGRARVRVRISDGRAVVFDRVVATDTVLGDVGLSAPALALRVAREVVAILRPHLPRSVASWR